MTKNHQKSTITQNKKPPERVQKAFRAENETRTRDPDLGKVVLYQLSYFRSILGNCTPVLVNRDDKGTTILGTSKFFLSIFV